MKPEHLESLRYIHVGAAPVGETLINLFKEKAPNVVFREGKFFLYRSWLGPTGGIRTKAAVPLGNKQTSMTIEGKAITAQIEGM